MTAVSTPTGVRGENFIQDVIIYASNIKKFRRVDWAVFFTWIGLMAGLFFSVTGFIAYGAAHGVTYPGYVWNIPIGCFIFIVSISYDTIGHRSAYMEDLKSGEQLIHHITIFAGVTSCLALCLAYAYREAFMIPALVLTALSTMYSIFDEGMHWGRYKTGRSDRIEMWAHFGIFVGHNIMMGAWVYWFWVGYPGVAETLAAM